MTGVFVGGGGGMENPEGATDLWLEYLNSFISRLLKIKKSLNQENHYYHMHDMYIYFSLVYIVYRNFKIKGKNNLNLY